MPPTNDVEPLSSSTSVSHSHTPRLANQAALFTTRSRMTAASPFSFVLWGVGIAILIIINCVTLAMSSADTALPPPVVAPWDASVTAGTINTTVASIVDHRLADVESGGLLADMDSLEPDNDEDDDDDDDGNDDELALAATYRYYRGKQSDPRGLPSASQSLKGISVARRNGHDYFTSGVCAGHRGCPDELAVAWANGTLVDRLTSATLRTGGLTLQLSLCCNFTFDRSYFHPVQHLLPDGGGGAGSGGHLGDDRPSPSDANALSDETSAEQGTQTPQKRRWQFTRGMRQFLNFLVRAAPPEIRARGWRLFDLRSIEISHDATSMRVSTRMWTSAPSAIDIAVQQDTEWAPWQISLHARGLICKCPIDMRVSPLVEIRPIALPADLHLAGPSLLCLENSTRVDVGFSLKWSTPVPDRPMRLSVQWTVLQVASQVVPPSTLPADGDDDTAVSMSLTPSSLVANDAVLVTRRTQTLRLHDANVIARWRRRRRGRRGPTEVPTGTAAGEAPDDEGDDDIDPHRAPDDHDGGDISYHDVDPTDDRQFEDHEFPEITLSVGSVFRATKLIVRAEVTLLRSDDEHDEEGGGDVSRLPWMHETKDTQVHLLHVCTLSTRHTALRSLAKTIHRQGTVLSAVRQELAVAPSVRRRKPTTLATATTLRGAPPRGPGTASIVRADITSLLYLRNLTLEATKKANATEPVLSGVLSQPSFVHRFVPFIGVAGKTYDVVEFRSRGEGMATAVDNAGDRHHLNTSQMTYYHPFRDQQAREANAQQAAVPRVGLRRDHHATNEVDRPWITWLEMGPFPVGLTLVTVRESDQLHSHARAAKVRPPNTRSPACDHVGDGPIVTSRYGSPANETWNGYTTQMTAATESFDHAAFLMQGRRMTPRPPKAALDQVAALSHPQGCCSTTLELPVFIPSSDFTGGNLTRVCTDARVDVMVPVEVTLHLPPRPPASSAHRWSLVCRDVTFVLWVGAFDDRDETRWPAVLARNAFLRTEVNAEFLELRRNQGVRSAGDRPHEEEVNHPISRAEEYNVSRFGHSTLVYRRRELLDTPGTSSSSEGSSYPPRVLLSLVTLPAHVDHLLCVSEVIDGQVLDAVKHGSKHRPPHSRPEIFPGFGVLQRVHHIVRDYRTPDARRKLPTDGSDGYVSAASVVVSTSDAEVTLRSPTRRGFWSFQIDGGYGGSGLGFDVPLQGVALGEEDVGMTRDAVGPLYATPLAVAGTARFKLGQFSGQLMEETPVTARRHPVAPATAADELAYPDDEAMEEEEMIAAAEEGRRTAARRKPSNGIRDEACVDGAGLECIWPVTGLPLRGAARNVTAAWTVIADDGDRLGALAGTCPGSTWVQTLRFVPQAPSVDCPRPLWTSDARVTLPSTLRRQRSLHRGGSNSRESLSDDPEAISQFALLRSARPNQTAGNGEANSESSSSSAWSQSLAEVVDGPSTPAPDLGLPEVTLIESSLDGWQVDNLPIAANISKEFDASAPVVPRTDINWTLTTPGGTSWCLLQISRCPLRPSFGQPFRLSVPGNRTLINVTQLLSSRMGDASAATSTVSQQSGTGIADIRRWMHSLGWTWSITRATVVPIKRSGGEDDSPHDDVGNSVGAVKLLHAGQLVADDLPNRAVLRVTLVGDYRLARDGTRPRAMCPVTTAVIEITSYQLPVAAPDVIVCAENHTFPILRGAELSDATLKASCRRDSITTATLDVAELHAAPIGLSWLHATRLPIGISVCEVIIVAPRWNASTATIIRLRRLTQSPQPMFAAPRRIVVGDTVRLVVSLLLASSGPGGGSAVGAPASVAQASVAMIRVTHRPSFEDRHQPAMTVGGNASISPAAPLGRSSQQRETFSNVSLSVPIGRSLFEHTLQEVAAGELDVEVAVTDADRVCPVAYAKQVIVVVQALVPQPSQVICASSTQLVAIPVPQEALASVVAFWEMLNGTALCDPSLAILADPFGPATRVAGLNFGDCFFGWTIVNKADNHNIAAGTLLTPPSQAADDPQRSTRVVKVTVVARFQPRTGMSITLVRSQLHVGPPRSRPYPGEGPARQWLTLAVPAVHRGWRLEALPRPGGGSPSQTSASPMTGAVAILGKRGSTARHGTVNHNHNLHHAATRGGSASLPHGAIKPPPPAVLVDPRIIDVTLSEQSSLENRHRDAVLGIDMTYGVLNVTYVPHAEDPAREEVCQRQAQGPRPHREYFIATHSPLRIAQGHTDIADECDLRRGGTVTIDLGGSNMMTRGEPKKGDGRPDGVWEHGAPRGQEHLPRRERGGSASSDGEEEEPAHTATTPTTTPRYATSFARDVQLAKGDTASFQDMMARFHMPGAVSRAPAVFQSVLSRALRARLPSSSRDDDDDFDNGRTSVRNASSASTRRATRSTTSALLRTIRKLATAFLPVAGAPQTGRSGTTSGRTPPRSRRRRDRRGAALDLWAPEAKTTRWLKWWHDPFLVEWRSVHVADDRRTVHISLRLRNETIDLLAVAQSLSSGGGVAVFANASATGGLLWSPEQGLRDLDPVFFHALAASASASAAHDAADGVEFNGGDSAAAAAKGWEDVSAATWTTFEGYGLPTAMLENVIATGNLVPVAGAAAQSPVLQRFRPLSSSVEGIVTVDENDIAAGVCFIVPQGSTRDARKQPSSSQKGEATTVPRAAFRGHYEGNDSNASPAHLRGAANRTGSAVARCPTALLNSIPSWLPRRRDMAYYRCVDDTASLCYSSALDNTVNRPYALVEHCHISADGATILVELRACSYFTLRHDVSRAIRVAPKSLCGIVANPPVSTPAFPPQSQRSAAAVVAPTNGSNTSAGPADAAQRHHLAAAAVVRRWHPSSLDYGRLTAVDSPFQAIVHPPFMLQSEVEFASRDIVVELVGGSLTTAFIARAQQQQQMSKRHLSVDIGVSDDEDDDEEAAATSTTAATAVSPTTTSLNVVPESIQWTIFESGAIGEDLAYLRTPSNLEPVRRPADLTVVDTATHAARLQRAMAACAAAIPVRVDVDGSRRFRIPFHLCRNFPGRPLHDVTFQLTFPLSVWSSGRHIPQWTAFLDGVRMLPHSSRGSDTRLPANGVLFPADHAMTLEAAGGRGKPRTRAASDLSVSCNERNLTIQVRVRPSKAYVTARDPRTHALISDQPMCEHAIKARGVDFYVELIGDMWLHEYIPEAPLGPPGQPDHSQQGPTASLPATFDARLVPLLQAFGPAELHSRPSSFVKYLASVTRISDITRHRGAPFSTHGTNEVIRVRVPPCTQRLSARECASHLFSGFETIRYFVPGAATVSDSCQVTNAFDVIGTLTNVTLSVTQHPQTGEPTFSLTSYCGRWRCPENRGRALAGGIEGGVHQSQYHLTVSALERGAVQPTLAALYGGHPRTHRAGGIIPAATTSSILLAPLRLLLLWPLSFFFAFTVNTPEASSVGPVRRPSTGAPDVNRTGAGGSMNATIVRSSSSVSFAEVLVPLHSVPDAILEHPQPSIQQRYCFAYPTGPSETPLGHSPYFLGPSTMMLLSSNESLWIKQLQPFETWGLVGSVLLRRHQQARAIQSRSDIEQLRGSGERANSGGARPREDLSGYTHEELKAELRRAHQDWWRQHPEAEGSSSSSSSASATTTKRLYIVDGSIRPDDLIIGGDGTAQYQTLVASLLPPRFSLTTVLALRSPKVPFTWARAAGVIGSRLLDAIHLAATCLVGIAVLRSMWDGHLLWQRSGASTPTAFGMRAAMIVALIAGAVWSPVGSNLYAWIAVGLWIGLAATLVLPRPRFGEPAGDTTAGGWGDTMGVAYHSSVSEWQLMSPLQKLILIEYFAFHVVSWAVLLGANSAAGSE